MALFSRNKETKTGSKAPKAAARAATANSASAIGRDLSSVIIGPRITEKGVGLGDKNVYTFVVRRDATKYDVRDAIKQVFNVTPVSVNIVNKSPRQYKSQSKGRRLTEKGMKKAYVYLKDGDSISLI